MRKFPSQFLFLCGAHMDQVVRLKSDAVMGSSNPATIEMSPGGAALNSASIAAALGLDCTLASPVGDDLNGQALRKICSERGIAGHLVTGSASTGIYAGIFNPDGDIVLGAADLALYDDINADWLAANCQSHAGTDMGLFLTTNLSSDLMETACKGFATVAAVTISPAKAVRLEPVLDRIDVLFTNHKEALALLNIGAATGEELVNALRQRGVKVGCISNSEKALWYWSGDASGEIIPPAPPVLTDVNGAGDALAGACLAALAAGLPMEAAVRYAMEIAAITLAHAGPYPEGARKIFPPIPSGNR